MTPTAEAAVVLGARRRYPDRPPLLYNIFLAMLCLPAGHVLSAPWGVVCLPTALSTVRPPPPKFQFLLVIRP